MKKIILRSLKILILLLIPILLIAQFGNTTIALSVYAVLISIWLIINLIQIGLLLRWLNRPKLSTIPQGMGIWRTIYATLLRHAKSRKKRKRKINTILQRFYKATAAMPNGVIIIDKNGRITWMNALAAEHFQLNQQDDIKGILINLIRLPKFQDFINRSIPDEEMKIQLPSAITERTITIRCSQFDKNLKMIISQDISHLEKLNTTRSDFVANVSHELRTPLTVINGFLETFADNPNLSEDERQTFIGLMQKEGLRMQNLLNDLLILSRLENEHLIDEKDNINLSDLCEKLSESGKALSNGQHHISSAIEADLWLSGSLQDLYNGLSNIVFNAIRYTPASGTIHISLTKIEDENQHIKLRFSVRDNGTGIASEHIPRLTERFYRVDSGRSRQQGGTGLGLAITKHVLANHNSYLQVNSTVGEGSDFFVLFDPIDAPISLASPN